MSTHACFYCHARLMQDNAVWVDVTGGDVCPGNPASGFNENNPHHAKVLSEHTIRLDIKSVSDLFTILDEYEEMALGYWDEDESEEPDPYPDARNGVRLLRTALLMRES
jgi:hypothetical protein